MGEERAEKGEGRGEHYSYDEAWAMSVVVIEKAKGKTHKTGYITLYTKFFKAVVCLFISKMRWVKKSKSFFIPMSYL